MKIIVFISGTGSNLEYLIKLQQTKQLDIEIVKVISNNPNAKGINHAKKANIPVTIIDSKKTNNTEEFEQKITSTINSLTFDLIVLAGFMKILSSKFVNQFSGKIINLHPALLPLFPGLNTHQRVIDAGHKEHGSSIHFVTPELDGGPVITQTKIAVNTNDTAASLQTRLKPLEHQLLAYTLNLLKKHNIVINNEYILFDDKKLQQPILFAPNSNSNLETFTIIK